MGIWWSETFKKYISNQLNSFYKGMSMDMNQQLNSNFLKGAPLQNITRETVSAAPP